MPVDYSKYPPDWHEISYWIRFYRAENHCEFCDVENYSIGFWVDGEFITEQEAYEILRSTGEDLYASIPINKKAVRVVLTVAHLDQDITNNEMENLAALCQRCHLNYDRPYNIRRRRDNRWPNQLKLEL